MVCEDKEFWLDDVSVLWKCWSNLNPLSKKLTLPAGPYNALSRLVIILSIILSLLEMKIYPLIVGLISLAVIAIVYHIKNNSKNEKSYAQGSEAVLLNENPNPDLDTQQREYGPLTTLDCPGGFPYGNPNPYQKCIAANQKPLGCMNIPVYGDQFIDKLYNGPQIIPPGINFNRVPDTTTMARPPYPLTSMDAVTKWVGETDNIGHAQLR